MIRSPLGLRLDSSGRIKEQIREAATAGAKGVLLDASGLLAPDQLSDTGKRELRHTLRSCELELIGLNLPTRRPFDDLDRLEDRLARADRAFALAYELGTRLVIAQAVGGLPPEAEAVRRSTFATAVRELGIRADHRGVTFALGTGTEPGRELASFLIGLDLPTLAANVDPFALVKRGVDPVVAVTELGKLVAHVFASDGAAGSVGQGVANPRGFGFAPGVLDWEAFLGSLEEVDYRGYLTVWPRPEASAVAEFQAVADWLKRF
jgi:sugar phosphate isomerase/epimerase